MVDTQALPYMSLHAATNFSGWKHPLLSLVLSVKNSSLCFVIPSFS